MAVLLDAHTHELRVARIGRIVAPAFAHLLAVVLLVLAHEALFERLELLFVFHSCRTFHTGERLLHARDQSVETLLARVQLAQVAGQRVARIERGVVQQTPDGSKRHAAFPVQQHLMQPVDFGRAVAPVPVAGALRANEPQLVVMMQRAHRASRQLGQLVHRVPAARPFPFHERLLSCVQPAYTLTLREGQQTRAIFSTGLRLRGAPLARRYSKEGHVLIEVDKQY